ncbi:hypothetical protein BDR04DRAFT_983036, partial [Suillus decipiens]
IIYHRKNHYGFWTNEKLLKQNALNAKEMNVKPDDKQRAIYGTYIPMDNLHPVLCKKLQMMNFPYEIPSDHSEYRFCSQPKGMQHVLEDHGLV